jgi:hypothetical protein
MTSRKLIVLYDGPEDFNMDAELREVITKYGWTWYAQEMDLEENERDISFYREDDEELT